MSTNTLTPAREPMATAPPVTVGRRWLARPTIVAASVATAVAVNLVIWAIGALAGGSFEFTDGGETMSAAPGGVIVLTAVPVGVGMTLAALLSLRWSGVLRVAQVLGSVLAVATIGLTLDADFDGASTVALSLTHLALVPVLVVGLELLRHHPPLRSRSTTIRSV